MLNIKNPRAHALASELAAATGESLTEAVINSLEERLERTRRTPSPRDIERARALIAEIRGSLKPLEPGEDPTAFLYDDETGLPA